MKKIMILVFSILFTLDVSAYELSDFLSACGYGTLIGAGVGVVSLAFEKTPSEHSNNIARGASLGLYGGIIYGIAKYTEEPQTHEVVLVNGDLYGLFYKFNF